MTISKETKFGGLASVAFGVVASALLTKVDPSSSIGSLAQGFGVLSSVFCSLILAKCAYNCYESDCGRESPRLFSLN